MATRGKRDAVRTVWFYRSHFRRTGGTLKHSHYFGHVRSTRGFSPRIVFGTAPADELDARERARLWPSGTGTPADRWAPGPHDVLFLAGLDWRYLERIGLKGLPNPRINLVQHVRHAHEGTERYEFLSERAVRICVSPEVADAIAATGRTTGPVLTISNGTDLTPFAQCSDGSPAGYANRRLAVTIAGLKRRRLARRLSGRLRAAGIEHRLLTDFVDRDAFLELLAGSRVAVCLPGAEEGFYLPALEGMAKGAIVVTLDCIGNRGFCRHGDNCFVVGPKPDSLLGETLRALALPVAERVQMHRRARDTAAIHSLDAERARFQAILGDIDRLWSTG